MEKRLLIVGLDPGTTVGYALLDIDGSVAKLGSGKELTLDKIIGRVAEYGRVVVVGTDKAHCPRFVESFATKMGARCVVPNVDLSSREKSELARGIKAANEHESDAFASALYAYKSVKPLLAKIESALKSSGKEHLSNKVSELLLTGNGMSIIDAVRFVEKPARIVIAAMPKRAAEEGEPIDARVREAHAAITKLKAELRMVHEQNAKLIAELELSQSRDYYLEQKLEAKLPEGRIKRLLRFKEKRIKQMAREVEELSKRAELLRSFLAGLGQKVLLKRLETLRYEEYVMKEKMLCIQRGDILLVDDVSKHSRKTIDDLKEKGATVICRDSSSVKLQQSLGIVLIDGSKLRITEEEQFGVVDRGELEREIHSSHILDRIVGDYRASRR